MHNIRTLLFLLNVLFCFLSLNIFLLTGNLEAKFEYLLEKVDQSDINWSRHHVFPLSWLCSKLVIIYKWKVNECKNMMCHNDDLFCTIQSTVKFCRTYSYFIRIRTALSINLIRESRNQPKSVARHFFSPYMVVAKQYRRVKRSTYFVISFY